MRTHHGLFRFVGVVLFTALVWLARVTAAPTVITDDFSNPVHWPVVESAGNVTMTCVENRLVFTCPASPGDESASVCWVVTTLPADRDWSVRCQAHLDAIPPGVNVERWLAQLFGIFGTGTTGDNSVGMEFSRDPSGVFSVSDDNRVGGTAVPDTFRLGVASGTVGLRIDYRAATNRADFYVDTDGVDGSAGWVRVGGTGTSALQADSFTVYLRSAAQDVAVTSGMMSFRDFEAVLDPGYELADYHMPAVTGATWLYWGTDWSGDASFTRLQIADPAFALDLYQGTTDPTSYFVSAVKLAYSHGEVVGGVYQPRANTDWYEYGTTTGAFSMLGWDTPPDESGRMPEMSFPSQMAAGQRVELVVPYYFFGVYSGFYYCAVELLGSETVTVPVGTFPDCIHLRFYASTVGFSDPDGQVYDEWRARGVGIVRYQGVSGYGAEHRRELESYTRPDLTPAVHRVPAVGEVYPLDLAFEGTWVVEASADWVHVSEASGTGDATLSVSVGPNSGPARQAAINIGGVVHWVSQADVAAPVIMTDVADRDGRIGTSTSFSVVASGEPELRYEWQRLAAEGTAFEYLAASATYVGVDSPTLQVCDLDLSMTGDRFRCVVRNDYGAIQTSSGELIVHEELYTSYADWASGEFAPEELADPAISGPSADPGGSGVPNLIRYAFGLAASGAVPEGAIAPVVLETVGGAGALSILVHRKSFAPDLRYVVEGSSDLRDWNPLATLSAGYPQDVPVRDTADTSAEVRRFLRVRVELLP